MSAQIPSASDLADTDFGPPQAKNYLNDETTVRSWLPTVDHKRTALLYLFTIIVFFTVAAFAAAFMHIELLTPQG